ncbi:MAG: DPP IV N-terminal domain-containing protein [Gemmatimonadota bacterium]
MLRPPHRANLAHAAVLLFATALPAVAQSPTPAQALTAATHPRANWTLADRFSAASLRSVVLSTAIQPRWLGETDSLWYNWRDRNGSRFSLVLPETKVKRPLFDHAKLAAELTELHHKPYDATNLPFTALTFTKDHKAFRFMVDSTRYEWSVTAQTLKSLGKMSRDSILPDDERERGGGGRGGGGGGAAGNPEFRNWSPDSSAFVFARNHNLYIVEKPRNDTVQITTDGVKNYSFGFRDTVAVQDEQQQQQQQDDQGGGGGRGGGASRDPRVRPNVVWSPDSKAFGVIRNDQRKVKELYLVNSLANPRPTLSSYSYAMPGEQDVAQQELYYFHRGNKSVTPLRVKKWKDQRLMDLHFSVGSEKLRLVRRDRPQRNLDVIELDLATNNVKVLLSETIENASLDPLPIRYTKRGGDMIWWSERSGWGHFYLYSHDGQFKKALTEGPWHTESVAQIDTVKGVIWITGNGREPGENVYLTHTYRMNADGTGFALVDPGNFNHTETISPTKKYMVDSYSRVDAPTKIALRDGTGHVVMDLEEADLARIKEMGWRAPEPFIVKAADGVTDIYGNMWKPFDFDSTKKYPIVANVYPGPQTESVNMTFSASNVPQQLAQLGMIVIQIGNRGGSPQRSLAYHRYGYYNMRDYALADKKSGIEQLAAKYKFIDIDRVGIYGHSGGGFLTGAALLQPPYNDFFKVGVSSSGNHDNNIYNQNWSEWNHGLKAVAANRTNTRADSARGRQRGTGIIPQGSPASAATAPDTSIVDDTLKYEIHVPTNIELAPNLKGRLLLVTGDMDNNVHPGNTIRLANALIKANKRFDFMIMPGKPHGYGDMQPYFTRMLLEYFAEHLIGDYERGSAEIK